MISLVDTGFLLDLEAGDRETTAAYELLRMNYSVQFLPIVSHELIFRAIALKDPVSIQFLFKQDLYSIDRVELTGIQLDCAKIAAEELLNKGLIKDSNTAHLVGEAASVSKSAFLLSHSKFLAGINFKSVNEVLSSLSLTEIRVVRKNRILRGI